MHMLYLSLHVINRLAEGYSQHHIENSKDFMEYIDSNRVWFPSRKTIIRQFACFRARASFLCNRFLKNMLNSEVSEDVGLQRVTTLKKRLRYWCFLWVLINIWGHYFCRTPAFSSFIFDLFWLQKQLFADVLQ